MKIYLKLIFILIFAVGCIPDNQVVTTETKVRNYKILSLGDSYTIGQNVCIDCRFPEQLKFALQNKYYNDSFSLQIIAQTGWTTSNLLTAIAGLQPKKDFDLVTLLIGVNNQYQNRPFASYQYEFPELITQSIAFAKGDKTNVIVVSIPDYAFTPAGQGSANISNQLKVYNSFAENYCLQNDITFVNITDITQQGLVDTNLVANDGLHPSQLAYAKFVERILPKAIEKLSN